MKHYHITIAEKEYDVEVLDDPRGGEVRVRVDGEVVTVKAENVASQASPVAPAAVAPVAVAMAAPVTAAAEPAPSGGSGAVKSPLPGVVKKISVRTGQQVKFNDELCVIEAMKAMNVIRAQKAGTIGKIYTAEGKRVAYGASLMDIE